MSSIKNSTRLVGRPPENKYLTVDNMIASFKALLV